MCPFVPLLPIICILINMYLLVNLGLVSLSLTCDFHLPFIFSCFHSYFYNGI